MLTAQKRKFALALMSGSNQTAAAIEAGYSEKTARSKGSQLANDPEVIAFIERKKHEVIEVDEVPASRRNVNTPAVNNVNTPPVKTESASPPIKAQYDDPLDYLKAVMNGLESDDLGRRDAAKAMLPYIHPKKGEGGKKDARNEAAKRAASGSKFGAIAPPKLIVNNKGNG
ncbi:terminase [Serratia marcescens]|nr:terminase [Serratia marcescens]